LTRGIGGGAQTGVLGRRRRGPGPRVELATGALALAAAVTVVVGASQTVTRFFWMEAAVWGAASLVAVAVVVSAATRVLADRERAREQIRLQTRVAEALARSSTLEETTAAILHALGEALHVLLAVAWRVDSRDERLRYVGVWASTALDAHTFVEDSERVEFERGQGVIGEVWKRGTPSVVRISTGRFRRQDLLEGLGAEAAVFVPITLRGQTIGVIECFTNEPDRFDDDMLDLVSQIGWQIGLAYDQAAQRAELAASEERRRDVLAAMLRAEEEARARLASDLHDDTIQVMAAAALSLDRILAALDRGSLDQVSRAAVGAAETLRHAIDRARHLMFELRPQLLADEGLAPAAQALLDDASAVAGFTYELSANLDRYTRPVENLCYRVLQEAITNIKKHAHASHVHVALNEHEGQIMCRITDDGVGFDLDRALDRNRMRLHLGLESMRERAHVAGGRLDIATTPGEGSVLAFTIPASATRDPLPQ
jgi:signal transduction histidine kinase